MIVGGAIIILAVISSFLNIESGLSLAFGEYVFCFTGLGETTLKTFYIGFPFALNVAFSGMVMIYLAFLIRRLFDRIGDRNWILILIAFASALIGTILFLLNKGNERLIVMSYAQYGNYLLFIGAAVLLSIAVLILSKYIDNKYFSKLGRYTLAIYGFHLSLIVVGNKLLNCFHVTDQNISAIIVGSITLALSCALIPVIRYIDPYILGERKK